ncbi:ubiquinone biosynthesis monooxygenase COQ6, mitochondrial-like [Ylistrum balloti]|uniref:ubiquinone biosynthesis monooxygenase COQ6, mitochondrial-like n=1 Tax=Ylistrum balloti TaxID=509963 RepID=UPI002905CA31|nr:ubiquinone biosynthesis monooxygenase COQ6, mitochondrial-like [Ylistrum balloti]
MSCTMSLKRCTLCFATIRSMRMLPTTSKKLQTAASQNEETVDIVISGGGMVGTAMACALGHEELLKDKKIVLLEAASKKNYTVPDTFSNRTCAISPSSVDLLNSVGAWEEVENMRCHPVKRMQVWDSCSDSLIAFSKENLLDDMAYIAENDVIEEALRKRLEAVSDRVDVRYQTSAKSYIIPGVTPGHAETHQNSWVTVGLQDNHVLKTKLLIGADGIFSAVRKAGEFHTLQRDYNQTAVVATLQVDESVDNSVAWQRFLPTGPIAMLPLSNKYSNLIWTTTPDLARNLKEIPEESFVDAVNDAFWHDRDRNDLVVKAGEMFQRVLNTTTEGGGGSFQQIPPSVVGVEANSRASFPLSMTHASNYVLHRVALLGDAAHRIHPLAGQGVNLGFGDVACLRDLLAETVSNGSDVGSLLHLTQYETTRQRAVIPVLATIDGLQRLYNTDFTPVVLLRSLGLQATNSMAFVKDYLVKGASG